MKIKELPKEFEKKCIKYTQIEKNDTFVIYRCKNLEFEDEYFELFRYRLQPPHPYSDEDYDMIEAYPTDTQFGLYAWCCSNVGSLLIMLKKHFDVEYDVKKLL